MSPVLVHYSLTLDLAAYSDAAGTVSQFVEQCGLSKIKKSVETTGKQCVIRFVVTGPETLADLQQAVRCMSRGLFFEATRAAVKTMKELPSDLFLELKVRPPLFGREEDGGYSST